MASDDIQASESMNLVIHAVPESAVPVWMHVAGMSVVATTPMIVFLVRLGLMKRSSSSYKMLTAINDQAASLHEAKSAAALVTFGVFGGAASAGWLFLVFGMWSNLVPPT